MKMLQQFEASFSGKVYRHRSSTVGDKLSLMVFEDLYDIAKSGPFRGRVDDGSCVVNTKNHATGKPVRRGDGTFGERVAPAKPTSEPGMHVLRGPVATIHVGVEVKILATAMIKQIDRVSGDLAKQAQFFRDVTANAITVGIVGVNHAAHYTSYERDRTYEKPENGDKAPKDEAAAATTYLMTHANTHFDEFLVLDFVASNRPPYKFSWLNEERTTHHYAAVLQRILGLYASRFG